MGSSFPAAAREISRDRETIRPASGARLKTAKVTPLRPAPLPQLASFSVIERHARESYPCQCASDCVDDATHTAFGDFNGVPVVVMLCASCAKKLPAHIKPIRIKGR